MSGVLNKAGSDSGVIGVTEGASGGGGGGGGISTHDAVASGALSNGDRVVLQADGKVKVIGLTGGGGLNTITSDAQETSLGLKTVESGPMIEFDPNDATKFAILYIDDSINPGRFLHMVIGTITGTTIYFGTAVAVADQNALGLQFTSGMWPAFQWHPRQANLIVITYGNTNGAQATWGWRICAGTVSGTTITMGFDDQLGSITNSVAHGRLAICCKVDTTDSQLPALTYSAAIMTFDGMSGIGAVMQVAGWIDSSGTSGTHGTPISVHSTQWNSGYTSQFQPWMRFDPNDEQKVALFCEDPTSSPALKPMVKIQTITNNMGTPTITQGSAQIVDSNASGRTKQIEWRTDIADSFILSWQSYFSPPGELMPCFIVGTVSGTSVTFGARYQIVSTTNMQRWDILIGDNPYDGGTGGTTFYGVGEGDFSSGSEKLYGKVFTISNNMGSLDIAAGNQTTLWNTIYTPGAIQDWDSDAGSNFQSATNGTKILTRSAISPLPHDHTSFSTGNIASAGSTNLTTGNYLGIADGAYSDGATATIQLSSPSIDDSQSGLTPGSTYYVQSDGTLATTADSPSVLAGIALSATQLLIKG